MCAQATNTCEGHTRVDHGTADDDRNKQNRGSLARAPLHSTRRARGYILLLLTHHARTKSHQIKKPSEMKSHQINLIKSNQITSN